MELGFRTGTTASLHYICPLTYTVEKHAAFCDITHFL